MCGLAGGVSNYLSQGEIETIQELGLLASFRGMDSTGMMFGAAAKKKNKAEYIYDKDITLPGSFLYEGRFKSVLKEVDRPWFIALHTRHATVGKVDKANAHPYNYKHICGMHNGTVPKYEPRPDEDGKTEAETDSYAIIQDLADLGVVETLTKAQDGAYALVWIDTKTHRLHMVRNHKRPLWIMQTPGKGTTFWASERRMLDFIAQGLNYKMNDPILLDTECLYTFENREGDFTKEKLDIPVIHKKAEDKEPSFFRRLFQEESKTTSQSTTTGLDGGKDSTSSDDPKDFGEFVKNLPGLEKKSLAKMEFLGYNERLPLYKARSLLACGCALCNATPSADDETTVVQWFNPNEFLCSSCYRDNNNRGFIKEYCNLNKDVKFEVGTLVSSLNS